jgi:hypothetical protein
VKLDTYARARRIATLLGPDWAFAISIPASGASTRICFSRGADRVVLEGSERIAAIGSNLKDLRERMAALLETIHISSGDGREGDAVPASRPCFLALELSADVQTEGTSRKVVMENLSADSFRNRGLRP